MSAHMKMRHIDRSKKPQAPKSRNIAWREVFKREITTYTERGLYLRGLRGREGMTQAQLAHRLGTGVSQHHISEMEHGKRNISPQMARRLAKVLKTDYRMLL